MSNAKPKTTRKKSVTPKTKKENRKLVGEQKTVVNESLMYELAEIAASADERMTFLVANTSSFQLRAQRIDEHNQAIPEVSLKFINGRCVPTEEELALAQDVINGVHTDGYVNSLQMQRAAKMVGLQIVKSGLAQPPMQTWDTQSEKKVVETAKAAGLLEETKQILNAIRYEKESLEREPSREPRQIVLEDLDILYRQNVHMVERESAPVEEPADDVVTLPSTVTVG